MARRFAAAEPSRDAAAHPARRHQATGAITPLLPMLRYVHVLAAAFALAMVAMAVPAIAQDGRELTEDARKQYAQALKAATALVKEQRYADAMEKLDALLRDRPREPQARFLKSIIETDQGKRDAAMATLRGLIEDYPELPEPYNNLAVLLAQKGEYESARLALETAVRTAPDWPVAHENLGDVYAQLAAAEYDRAAKLDRANKSAPLKRAAAGELLKLGEAGKPGP
jgi:tetratricopeptide (TPR) repeat protein